MLLFDHFLVARVSSSLQPRVLTSVSPAKTKFPAMVMQFIYPDLPQFASPKGRTEHYAFAMTGKAGEKMYGFCNRRLIEGSKFPEVLCILSRRPYHAFFKSVLQCVQGRWKVNQNAGLLYMRKLGEIKPRFNQNVCQLHVRRPKGVESTLYAIDHEIDYPFMRDDYSFLMNKVSPDDLLAIFNAMLLEKKIVVLSESLPDLSNVVHSLISLLYPLQWQHIFIPILPPKHVKFCCAPMPFFIGLQKRNLKKLLSIGLEEVVLVDVDSKQVNLVGGSTSTLKSILPVELTGKLRKRLLWKEARRSPRFIQSCFTAFFAVLFAPCDWNWERSTGGFNVDRLINRATEEQADLVPCFKAIRHSQMFETFSGDKVEAEKKRSGKAKQIDTFDMLIEMCRSQPTSFKFALKSIQTIHANRYEANRLLPPLPRHADLIKKLAHTTLTNTKTSIIKAQNKFSKFFSKIGGKKSNSNKSIDTVEEDEDPFSDRGEVKADTINTSHRAKELDQVPTDGQTAGTLMANWLKTPRHKMPNFHETLMDFTSNNPQSKRNTNQILEEICLGTAHSVSSKHIMEAIFERLRDSQGKSWRHGYQALVVLLHLLEYGGDWVTYFSSENQDDVKALLEYRHQDQDRQGKIRQLAQKACRAIGNIFALRRMRRIEGGEEDNKQDKKQGEVDPWAEGLKSRAGMKGRRAVARQSSIVGIRTMTLIDGKGPLIPQFSTIHLLLRPQPKCRPPDIPGAPPSTIPTTASTRKKIQQPITRPEGGNTFDLLGLVTDPPTDPHSKQSLAGAQPTKASPLDSFVQHGFDPFADSPSIPFKPNNPTKPKPTKPSKPQPAVAKKNKSIDTAGKVRISQSANPFSSKGSSPGISTSSGFNPFLQTDIDFDPFNDDGNWQPVDKNKSASARQSLDPFLLAAQPRTQSNPSMGNLSLAQNRTHSQSAAPLVKSSKSTGSLPARAPARSTRPAKSNGSAAASTNAHFSQRIDQKVNVKASDDPFAELLAGRMSKKKNPKPKSRSKSPHRNAPVKSKVTPKPMPKPAVADPLAAFFAESQKATQGSSTQAYDPFADLL